MMQKEVWLNFHIVKYLFCNTHLIYSLQMRDAYLLKQKQDKIVMPIWLWCIFKFYLILHSDQ